MALNMNEKGLRVGVFDSGLGGISVLTKAMDILPNEKFLYYADVDNVPYGNKSKEEIIAYVDKAADYMVSAGCKAILIACNTATSIGVDFLREKYDFLPIIGIEPAVKPAVLKYAKDKRVLVVATAATIKGPKLDILIKKFDKDNIVDKLALPKLASYAEEGIFNPERIVPYLKKELEAGKYEARDYSVIVLGCTHFSFFKDSFKELFPNAVVIDGSKGSAKYLKTRMEEEGLLASTKGESFSEEEPRLVIVESGRLVTDDTSLNKVKDLFFRLARLRELR